MSEIQDAKDRADQAVDRLTSNVQRMERLVLEFGLALAREQDRREKAEQKAVRLAAALRKIAADPTEGTYAPLNEWRKLFQEAQRIAKDAMEDC